MSDTRAVLQAARVLHILWRDEAVPSSALLRHLERQRKTPARKRNETPSAQKAGIWLNRAIQRNTIPLARKTKPGIRKLLIEPNVFLLVGSPAFVDYCQLVLVEMVAALALVRCDGSLAVILARAPIRRPCAHGWSWYRTAERWSLAARPEARFPYSQARSLRRPGRRARS